MTDGASEFTHNVYQVERTQMLMDQSRSEAQSLSLLQEKTQTSMEGHLEGLRMLQREPFEMRNWSFLMLGVYLLS